jgi:hypothetical protein
MGKPDGEQINPTEEDKMHAQIYSVAFSPIYQKIQNTEMAALSEEEKFLMLKEALEVFLIWHTGPMSISPACYWLFSGIHEEVEWLIFEHCSSDTVERWNFYMEFSAQTFKRLSHNN